MLPSAISEKPCKRAAQVERCYKNEFDAYLGILSLSSNTHFVYVYTKNLWKTTSSPIQRGEQPTPKGFKDQHLKAFKTNT